MNGSHFKQKDYIKLEKFLDDFCIDHGPSVGHHTLDETNFNEKMKFLPDKWYVTETFVNKSCSLNGSRRKSYNVDKVLGYKELEFTLKKNLQKLPLLFCIAFQEYGKAFYQLTKRGIFDNNSPLRFQAARLAKFKILGQAF